MLSDGHRAKQHGGENCVTEQRVLEKGNGRDITTA
jgi:hypothetical protein